MLDLIDAQPVWNPRLTREQYHRLGEADVFGDQRTELVYGVVLLTSPKFGRHTWSTRTTADILRQQVGELSMVRVQDPVVAFGESEPEPDVAVVPPGDYLDEHPTTAWLVVEVAESSLKRDLGVKADLYARSGFREYWVVDQVHRQVVVHRDPSPEGTWASIARHGPEATLRPVALPGVSVAVSDVLPPG